jgi:SpoIID/LytB domain protein
MFSMNSLQQDLEALYDKQLQQWQLCRQNYADVAEVEVRTITLDGADYRLQFNPARIRSARADVRGGQVDRPCFLCRHRRPTEQIDLSYTAPDTQHEYLLSVNPYPIVSHHFTLVAAEHVPQQLSGRVDDMKHLAEQLPDYLIFFNGACSGASAPDHMHFQAVPQASVPLLQWAPEVQARLGIIGRAPVVNDSDFLNVACWSAPEPDGGRSLRWLTVERLKHRPSQYFATGEEQCLISPATLEFCGLVPLARREDFERMDAALLSDIFRQVRRLEPRLRVGIIEAPTIDFYYGGRKLTATYRAEDCLEITDSTPLHSTSDALKHVEKELWVWQSPFTLPAVTIGKEFHWQQQESQTFGGVLQLKAVHGRLVAINHISVETYLRSVIASEMSADNNLELLKTHAVISRSWVLRQMFPSTIKTEVTPSAEAGDRVIAWFDHDDHIDFDVCADDHCQRYQGITRVRSKVVDEAIAATRGEVLVATADGSLCDARFSKCCGGVSEAFETCWQDEPHDYLRPIIDAPAAASTETVHSLALDTEAGARRWIESSAAPSFCNTTDPRVLALVLNTYDRTTVDFYRWQVRYTRSELSALVERKMHLGLGRIIALRPLRRGPSGRIYELQIEGEQRTVIVGKELMIRKALSETHLYSSAFVVDEDGDDIVLRGAGWGHGVGLCQIGAACMSLRGFGYRDILAHYFPNTTLQQSY